MIQKIRPLAFALALASTALAIGAPATAQPADPSGGWWGPGMMRGYGPGPQPGYGPGMMGRWGGPDDSGGYGNSLGMGPWMMGRGGYGQGYGPGMMYGYGPGGQGGYGPGYGPGMMWGWNTQPAELNLTVDQVKSNFERWLAFHANPRVKLGPVAEKDASTITVDIVTVDKGGLVQRFSVDRKTGAMRAVEG